MKSRDDRRLKDIKGASWRDKADYIWTYYKYHILGGLMGVLIIVYALNAFVINPAPKPYVAVGLYGGTSAEADALKSALSDILPEGDESAGIVVYAFDFNNEDFEYAHAMRLQFDALLHAGELDLLIIGDENARDAAGVFVPLEDILSGEGLDELSERLLSADGRAAAVRLAGNAARLFSERDLALGFTGGLERREAAKDAFLKLLE
jgi:hypothetical protein